MLRTIIGHLVAGLMLASVLIIACGPDTAGLGTLPVPELAALLDQDKSVVVCDVPARCAQRLRQPRARR